MFLLCFLLIFVPENWTGKNSRELSRVKHAAVHAASIGLECHAGHGLGFDTVGPIAGIPEIAELNIGHFLIGEAIFSGLDSTVKQMRTLMDTSRARVLGEMAV